MKYFFLLSHGHHRNAVCCAIEENKRSVQDAVKLEPWPVAIPPCARHHAAASLADHWPALSQAPRAASRLDTSGNRSAGALARHLRTMASTSAGTFGLFRDGGSGDSYNCAAATFIGDGLENGGRPVSKKYA